MFTLTAAAKARGWDAAFGPGVLLVKDGQSGRGERKCAVTSDAGAVVRFVSERSSEVDGRTA